MSATAQPSEQQPAPHADSQGSVGRDTTIQEAKVEPLWGALAAEKGSKGSDGTYKGTAPGNITKGAEYADTKLGVDDEVTGGAKIAPLGAEGGEGK